jgi:hypothetical protein
MKNMYQLSAIAAAAIIIPSPAFAYIDPAMGSMLFQGVIGAIAIAGTAWYTLRQKASELYSSVMSAVKGRSPADK